MSGVELVVAQASARELTVAVEVWRSANTARGLPPSSDRVARVQEKIRADDALLVVGRVDTGVVAMALAEPGRRADGHGEIVPGWGHVCMVFVAPDLWGHGVGTALMSGLHGHAVERGWTTLTLWTRQNNHRAQRLYAATGYRHSRRASALPTGETIIRLERP